MSSMSHSSPRIHLNADSLPFSMPHSNSVHSPRLSMPTYRPQSFSRQSAPPSIGTTPVLEHAAVNTREQAWPCRSFFIVLFS